ncbi:MAG: hypothetical protein M1813_008859 [Trichoglossum hirsutum]|nr:MAG: hypothetical protein M1813_008859 [Trichoglossum hirsutum]
MASPSKGRGMPQLNGDRKATSTQTEPNLREFVQIIVKDSKTLQNHLEQFTRYAAEFQNERKYQEELRKVEEDRDELKGCLMVANRALLRLGGECEAYKQEVDKEYKEKSKGVVKLERKVEELTSELEGMKTDWQKVPARLQQHFENGENHQKDVDYARMKDLTDQNTSLKKEISTLAKKVNEGKEALAAERSAHEKDKRDAGFIMEGLEARGKELEENLEKLTSFREPLSDNEKYELEQQQLQVEELVHEYFPELPPKAMQSYFQVSHTLPPDSPFNKIYQSGTATEGLLCRAAARDIISKAFHDNIYQHPVLRLSKILPKDLTAAVQELGHDKESTFRLLAVEILERLEKTNRLRLGTGFDLQFEEIIKHVRSHMKEPQRDMELGDELKDGFQDAERLWMSLQKTKLGIKATFEDFEYLTTTDPDSDQAIEFHLSPNFQIPNPSPHVGGKQSESGLQPQTISQFVAGSVLRRGSQSFQMNLQEKREFDELRAQLAQKNNVASPALEGTEFGGESGKGEASPVGPVKLRRREGRIGRPLSVVVA